MAITSIQIDTETKLLLNQLKQKFSYGTYDSTVRTMAIFIIRNELNLNQDYLGNYEKSLVNLEVRLTELFALHEKRMIKSNASLRDWVGGIEKDYLKPLTAKFVFLDKIADYELSKIGDANLNNTKSENPLNFNVSPVKQIENSEPITDEKQTNIFDNSGHVENEIRSNDEEIQIYKNALKKIIFSSNIVNRESMTGLKKIIELDIEMEEWNYFNSLI